MKTCTIVYNPHSGKKVKYNFLAEYIDILLENGYDPNVIFSKYQGHIAETVPNLKDCDLLLTIGGDGTFNEAINGNLKRKKRLTMAHIPVGTTNDVGAMFGYGADPVKNLKLLMKGQKRKIDIGIINDRAFVYVAGFGKFASVSYDTPRNRKKRWGHLAYIFEAFKEFTHRTKLYDIEYKIDDQKHRGLFSFVLVSNANRIAGIDQFYKEVKLNDGQVEVLLCTLTKRADILRSLFTIATGDITKVPGFYYYRTNNMKLTFQKAINWTVDGEKLEPEEKNYEIKIDRDFEVLIPSKNIAKNFK